MTLTSVVLLLSLLCSPATAEDREPPSRLSREVAARVHPILEALRESLSEDPYGARPKLYEVGVKLGRLAKDKSKHATEALAILFHFYLGEANGANLLYALSIRGSAALPFLEAQQREPPAILRDYPEAMRMEEDAKRLLYESLAAAIRSGEVIGAD